MRILVVNVNTTESMTNVIAETARSVASPATEIVGLTPNFGAESVEGNAESYLAAVAVQERVMSYRDPYDAVIQAGYGEHGREGLQELLSVPVVDITEASASIAMFLGHRYSIVTTLDRTVGLIEDRLKLAGLDARCASVRASGLSVLELERDPAKTEETIIAEAENAVHTDKAEVIVSVVAAWSGSTSGSPPAPVSPSSTASLRRSPSPNPWYGWVYVPRKHAPTPRRDARRSVVGPRCSGRIDRQPDEAVLEQYVFARLAAGRRRADERRTG